MINDAIDDGKAEPMFKTLSIALCLTGLIATSAAANQTTRGTTNLTAQIDGVTVSGGGRIERIDVFASDGGLGTTR